MSHTVADLGLHGYKNWRVGLIPLPVGTSILFVKGYDGVTLSHSVKPGQTYIITENVGEYYKMVITRNGKIMQKVMRFSVESIARWLIDGEVSLIGKQQ